MICLVNLPCELMRLRDVHLVWKDLSRRIAVLAIGVLSIEGAQRFERRYIILLIYESMSSFPLVDQLGLPRPCTPLFPNVETLGVSDRSKAGRLP